jgi:5-methylcytosine-specific restriction endonuclease McrA
MAGSLYSTARWQRLRREVIARDGGQCMLRSSPRCSGIAETAHHLHPTSEGGAFLIWGML